MRLLRHLPYVCNGCPKEKSCKKIHAYYSAVCSQRLPQDTQSVQTGSTHSTDEIIRSRFHPCANDSERPIPNLFSHPTKKRSDYEKQSSNYIDLNVFSFRNIDPSQESALSYPASPESSHKAEYEYRKVNHGLFSLLIDANPSPVTGNGHCQRSLHSGKKVLSSHSSCGRELYDNSPASRRFQAKRSGCL